MPKPPALLFDLDGTLVDSAITIAAALSELSLARGGSPVDVARTRRLVSKGASALVLETLGPLGGDGAEDLAAFRALLADIPARPTMIYCGVVDALKALTCGGHTCAVVTNKPEGLARLLLDELGLSRFFEAVVGGDSLSVCKPNPAPLRHALRLMANPSTARAVMIGDSAIDARAAAAAGLPFLLFLGGYEADGCNDEIIAGTFTGFVELPGLLGSLAAPHVRNRRHMAG